MLHTNIKENISLCIKISLAGWLNNLVLPSASSLLHTIRRCLRTMTKLLFHKKDWVSRNVTKVGLHTICHRLQFFRMCIATENTVKKFLWICQKITYSGKCISQKSFSRNAHESDKSLSTHYARFTQILSTRSFFVIVREQYVVGFKDEHYSQVVITIGHFRVVKFESSLQKPRHGKKRVPIF